MINRALLRFLARTPWSTTMAVIGMALGVTSIVSVHLVSASISQRLDGLVPEHLAGFTHFLHRSSLTADDYVELRRDWRQGALDSFQRLTPIVDETTQLSDVSVRVIGIDLLSGMPGVTGTTDAADFSWAGVWIDPSLEGKLSLPVNGIIEAPAGTLIADIGVALDLLDRPDDQLSYIGLVRDDPLRDAKQMAEQLLPGFGAGFPDRPPAVDLDESWQLLGVAEQYPAREFGKSVLFNISALGGLALLVAWLLIYQVAVSWLQRLWPVFDRLHVLGVDWQSLQRYFLFSLAAVATLAGGLGIAGGWWLANLLIRFTVPDSSIALDLNGWVILKGLGSAVVICLLGGAWAFRQAGRDTQYGYWLVSLTGLLLAISAWCLADSRAGLAGGFFAIAVVSLAASMTLAPLVRWLRRHASLVRGPHLLRIGIRESIWHPGELSVALAGLSLAIATAIGVELMVESFRKDFSRMLDHRLTYDLVIDGSQEELTSAAQRIGQSDTVTRLQVYRQTTLRVNGLPMNITMTDVDATEAARYQLPRALQQDEALLSEQAARVLELSPGDTFTLAGADLRVAGIFSAFGDIQPRLIISDLHALASDNRMRWHIDDISVNLSGSPTHAGELIASLRTAHPGLQIRQQSEIRTVALRTFDQTFAITTVLITIALLVATISVYIAVTTLRLNRHTGSRLLDTLGIHRFEKRIMDMAMGAGLGVVAIMVALPLGVLLGWILCQVINPRAFGWTIELQWSASALLGACAWGMLAAILAGLLQGGRQEEGDVDTR